MASIYKHSRKAGELSGMDSSPAFLYGYQVAAIHALGPAFSASLRAASIAAVAVSFAWKVVAAYALGPAISAPLRAASIAAVAV